MILAYCLVAGLFVTLPIAWIIGVMKEDPVPALGGLVAMAVIWPFSTFVLAGFALGALIKRFNK